MSAASPRVGLWMIGACGGVGSTVALGLAAMRRNLAPPTALATAAPPLSDAPMPAIRQIEIGGHEIRDVDLLDGIDELQRRAKLFQSELIPRCRAQLRQWSRHVRPGVAASASGTKRDRAGRRDIPSDRTPAAAVDRLADDIREFRSTHRLGHVIVVNLASTEARRRMESAHRSWASLRRVLDRRGACPIPESSVYALAAVEAGAAYVNFTPSTGIELPAIRERADALGMPYAGRDGKTGETLVKSALAPLFAIRRLRVLTWFGQNLLGNRDGEALMDPGARASKIASKSGLLNAIVGDIPTAKVAIDFVPSLDDWKLAWDFIHFEGFLGTRMTMQFCWHGSDSALAAPLVIDLTRLAALELARGAAGPMKHLACFFKDPIDVSTHDLSTQWRMLAEHVFGVARPRSTKRRRRLP